MGTGGTGHGVGQGYSSEEIGGRRRGPARAAGPARACGEALRVAWVGADGPDCVAFRDALTTHRGLWTLVCCPTLDHASRITHHGSRPPHVALAPVGPPPGPGPALISELKLLWPSSRVITVVDPAHCSLVFPSLLAGADGCLVKPLARHDLPAMIERAVSGLPAFCVDAQAAIIAAARRANSAPVSPGKSPAPAAGAPRLSAREKQVLACLEQGLLYKEIADRLHISLAKVHKLLHGSYVKLDADNRTEAIRNWHSASPSAGTP